MGKCKVLGSTRYRRANFTMATSRITFQMDMALESSQTAISTTVSMSMDTSRDKACLSARSKVGNTRANGKWVG